jgi:hypothetical protein
LGDNAYQDGTDTEYQTKVFSGTAGYQSMFPYQPFHATPGNHDYNLISPVQATVNPNNHSGVYYDIINAYENAEAGGVPSGTELYYSFDYGNIHVISINSELGSALNASHDWIGARLFGSFTGSPMMTWLQADLQQNTQPWTVVMFHQPPYSKGSHDSDDIWERYMIAMRSYWLPVLEDAGVDVVLCGHSHVYERSFLLKGHYGNSGSLNPSSMFVDGSSGNPALGETYYKDTLNNLGTLYVVQGNSGSSESGPDLNHPAFYFSHGCDTCAGSTVIDIHGDTLTGLYLSSNGQILDRYQIIKPSSPVNTTAVSNVDLYEENIRWYPNPTNGSISIQTNFEQQTDIMLSLYDASGKNLGLLYQGTCPAGEYVLDIDIRSLSQNKAGAYYIQYSKQGSARFLPVILSN